MRRQVKCINQRSDIKIVDLKDSPEKQLECLQDSLDRYGFFLIRNFFVDSESLKKACSLSERFFSLSLNEKKKYFYKGQDQKKYSNIGYFPFQSEKAIQGKYPDLKEFFHIGPSVFSSHNQDSYAQNIWPEFDENFPIIMKDLFFQFTRSALHALDLLSQYFVLPLDEMKDLTHEGGHVLRLLHYPPIEKNFQGERAAQHTGIQLLGFQPVPEARGLEYLTPQNQWIELDYKTFSDCTLVNIGDMFEFVTRGRAKASPHRVSNRCVDVDRYAMVFFFHANHVKELKTYGESIEGSLEKKQTITAGTWLKERIFELSLE
ncbi:MAG: isopenicillin N synthase family oxygenase [Bdellovibrionales bacterium]|nr:isopenicillin N synthase family oxygenase [Bdellovibrionales bacterium]